MNKNVVQGRFWPIKRNGFTLIELLVVVLIIGILSAVAVPQYQRAVEKARFVQAITIMDVLRKACEVYYLENGAYPTSLSELNINPNLPQGYFATLYHGTPPATGYFALDMMVFRNGKEVLEYVNHLQNAGKPSQSAECRVWEDTPVFHYVCQSVSGKTTGKVTTSYTAYNFYR